MSATRIFMVGPNRVIILSNSPHGVALIVAEQQCLILLPDVQSESSVNRQLI